MANSEGNVNDCNFQIASSERNVKGREMVEIVLSSFGNGARKNYMQDQIEDTKKIITLNMTMKESKADVKHRQVPAHTTVGKQQIPLHHC